MTFDELKTLLTEKGYTNLRVESRRSCYILADKDGKTTCFYPEWTDPTVL